MRPASRLLFGLGLLVLGGCYTSIDHSDATVGATLVPATSSDDTSGGSGLPSPSTSTGDSWDPTTAAASTGPVSTSTGLDPSTGIVPETSTGDEPPVSTSTTTGGPPADCPRVRVTVPPGDTLNVRPTPSTEMAPLGGLASGQIVDVVDIVQGEVIDGNGTWYQIQSNMLAGFVWGGWVECTLDEPAKDGFFLPLECGMMASISQGNFGDFSHQGQSAYAFDFSLGTGTPLVAIADGTVSNVYAETMPGDPCYNGGGQECSGQANYVTLQHGDGTKSIYAHLSAVAVSVGEFVPRGSPVGLSGSSGWSTGRHAHVARQEGCAGGWCQSIAVSFTDVPGDGVPKTGDVVVSGNCP